MFRQRPLWLMIATLSIACFSAACNNQPAAPAAPPDTRAADEAAIRAADAGFVKDAEAKELEKIMSLYADDAVLLASGAPAAAGKDNIRKFIQGMLAAPGLKLTVNTASVTVARSGDLAMDQGTVAATTTDKKGKPVTSTSQYVLVWKKGADGVWKIAADTSAEVK
jgi:uncharacterized protein (TIGR02246 family)